ncbi:AAA family ATPase [Sulfurimonas sp.]|uniref:ATP-dependent DNA helicase n=1 Tax=Sulfurimonas sp. TaxID=2022749 RepID=UPI0025D9B183|nr:AAA family ATPase [Sulfurimonas sp.]MDD5157334.1 AAA family ATPase [Sulfurimonas sp.]
MDLTNNILEKLKDKKSVFLTGGAGVGKTTITKNIIKHYEDDAKKVAKLASTAMAATLIDGQTLHSFLDFGIAGNLKELELNGKLDISKKVKKVLSSMSLLVIDEVSMVSDALLEMVHLRLLQADFKGSLLIVGDFLQLPPVVRGSSEVRFAFESSSWSKFAFEVVELTHIYRTDDKDFIELLKDIRSGYVDENVHNILNEFIKPLPQDLSQFTFLFGKNESASRHNKNQLEFIESELFIKIAEVVKHQKSVKDAEIERFMSDARVDKNLELKLGAPVLFTRNAWNYFNGERGLVVKIESEFVYVRKSDGTVVKLEAIAQSKKSWIEKSIGSKKEIVEESLFSVYQFPIKLAFAITIHKSQGMSIEDLIVETNEIFAPSQFYVAISRSSNPKRLTLIAPRKQWRDIVFVNQKALRFVRGS